MKKATSLLVIVAMLLVMAPAAFAASDIIAEDTKTFDSDAAAGEGMVYYFTPETDGTIQVEFTAAEPGYYIQLDNWSMMEMEEAVYGTELGTTEFYVYAETDYAITVSSAAVSGTNAGSQSAGSISYKISFAADERAVLGSIDNPIEMSSFPYAAKVGAGKTVYFMYDDMFLPMFGTYAQRLNIVGNGDTRYVEGNASYNVGFTAQVFCDGMTPKVVNADPYGFVNTIMTDDYGTGKYVIGITNNSSSDVTYYVTLEDAPVYEFAGVFVELGDNTVSLNTSAPTIIYEFNTGDSYDGDGNLLVDGPDEGIYVITIKDTAGNVIDTALVANWGNIGYPQDLTGESKTNTLEWSCTSAGATLLIGVSGVEAEEFVINVTLKQALEEEEEVVIPNYVNKHQPSAGFFPQVPSTDKLTYVDITKPHSAVLGADGYYHLNGANGPILYIDLVYDGVNMVNAYYPTEGQAAIHLRGQYTAENGEKFTIDFYTSLQSYVDAANSDGLYPLTEDLVEFLTVYGGSQGWFKTGYSPFSTINAGGFHEGTAWMANVCYFANDSTVIPEYDANAGNNSGSGSGTNDKLPTNGDSSAIFGVALAMLMSGAALVTMKKYF